MYPNDLCCVVVPKNLTIPLPYTSSLTPSVSSLLSPPLSCLEASCRASFILHPASLLLLSLSCLLHSTFSSCFIYPAFVICLLHPASFLCLLSLPSLSCLLLLPSLFCLLHPAFSILPSPFYLLSPAAILSPPLYPQIQCGLRVVVLNDHILDLNS